LDKNEYIKKLAAARVRHRDKLDDVLEEIVLINAATAIVLKQQIDNISDRIKKEIKENA